jgi:uncharacterized protein
MTTAILDTNIFIQYLIGSPRAASARTIEAYYDGRFRLAYSTEMFDELLEVLMLPRIRDRHGLTDSEILEYLSSLLVDADRYPAELEVSPAITRDVTDTKFLALAAESRAGFLVTNDHRHLLRLGSYEGTPIVTPATFLRELP